MHYISYCAKGSLYIIQSPEEKKNKKNKNKNTNKQNQKPGKSAYILFSSLMGENGHDWKI